MELFLTLIVKIIELRLLLTLKNKSNSKTKMDRAKRVWRRLKRGSLRTRYVSSPTGSLPPSPMGSPPAFRRGKKMRTKSMMSLNKIWRRFTCTPLWHFTNNCPKYISPSVRHGRFKNYGSPRLMSCTTCLILKK